jgi:hypothetical protein
MDGAETPLAGKGTAAAALDGQPGRRASTLADISPHTHTLASTRTRLRGYSSGGDGHDVVVAPREALGK